MKSVDFAEPVAVAVVLSRSDAAVRRCEALAAFPLQCYLPLPSAQRGERRLSKRLPSMAPTVLDLKI